MAMWSAELRVLVITNSASLISVPDFGENAKHSHLSSSLFCFLFLSKTSKIDLNILLIPSHLSWRIQDCSSTIDLVKRHFKEKCDSADIWISELKHMEMISILLDPVALCVL